MLGSGQDPSGLLFRRVNVAKIHHLIVLQQRLDGRNDLGIAAGAQNTVHFGHFRQYLLLIPLRQTAGDQDLAHHTGLLQPGSLKNIVNCLAGSRINETAGIDDHHVAAHQFLLHGVTGLLNAIHHPLTVHLILGTAKGNKSYFCHLVFLQKFLIPSTDPVQSPANLTVAMAPAQGGVHGPLHLFGVLRICDS